MMELLFFIFFNIKSNDSLHIEPNCIYYITTRSSCLSCQKDIFPIMEKLNKLKTIHIINIMYKEDNPLMYYVKGIENYKTHYTTDSVLIVEKNILPSNQFIFKMDVTVDDSYFIYIKKDKLKIIPVELIYNKKGKIKKKIIKSIVY